MKKTVKPMSRDEWLATWASPEPETRSDCDADVAVPAARVRKIEKQGRLGRSSFKTTCQKYSRNVYYCAFSVKSKKVKKTGSEALV